MKNLLAAFAALFAMSASPAAAPVPEPVRPPGGEAGIDGYVFQRKSFSRLALTIMVHEYRTRAEMHGAYRRIVANASPPPGLVGFATWNGEGCRIHVLDPATRYEPAIAGHELFHCLHGDFHPGQEKAR